MERSTEEGEIALERQWLDHDLPHSRAWREYQCTRRAYLYHNKGWVVWDYTAAGPIIVDLLTTGPVGVSWEGGLTVILNSQQSQRQFTVTAKPREEIPGVFMWLPGFADVRFAPMQFYTPGSARRLTIPICFRTAHSRMEPSARYISSVRDFNTAWPGILGGR